jgi:hypothetical protein
VLPLVGNGTAVQFKLAVLTDPPGGGYIAADGYEGHLTDDEMVHCHAVKPSMLSHLKQVVLHDLRELRDRIAPQTTVAKMVRVPSPASVRHSGLISGCAVRPQTFDAAQSVCDDAVVTSSAVTAVTAESAAKLAEWAKVETLAAAFHCASTLRKSYTRYSGTRMSIMTLNPTLMHTNGAAPFLPKDFVLIDLSNEETFEAANECLATMVRKTSLGPVTPWQREYGTAYAAYDADGVMLSVAVLIVGELNERHGPLRPIVSIEWLICIKPDLHYGWDFVARLKDWSRGHQGILVTQALDKEPAKGFWPKVFLCDVTYATFLTLLFAAHDNRYTLYSTTSVTCMYWQ